MTHLKSTANKHTNQTNSLTMFKILNTVNKEDKVPNCEYRKVDNWLRSRCTWISDRQKTAVAILQNKVDIVSIEYGNPTSLAHELAHAIELKTKGWTSEVTA